MIKSDRPSIIEIIVFVVICCIVIAAVTGCSQGPNNQEIQAEKGAQLAESIRFTSNAEQENIHRRLELTSDPALLGYVTLFHKTGQVALYTAVEGKITSGGKRLTPPDRNVVGHIRRSMSDEGTWGSSNPYVYFWTPSGQYFQTSMDYIYSDKPMRLREEPLVIMSE